MALNEGRGANPGDTSGCGPSSDGRANAQRRPGREPRRHHLSVVDQAQTGALNEGRGANPGDTPGAARPRRHRTPLNEGRGANPGDTACGQGGLFAAGTLNEGRGANPGDTLWAGST